MNEGKLRMKQISDTVYVLEEFVDGTWHRMDNTAISFDQAKAKANEQNLTVVGLDDKVQWPVTPESEVAPETPPVVPVAPEPDAPPADTPAEPAPVVATAKDYAAGEVATAKSETDTPHKPSK